MPAMASSAAQFVSSRSPRVSILAPHLPLPGANRVSLPARPELFGAPSTNASLSLCPDRGQRVRTLLESSLYSSGSSGSRKVEHSLRGGRGPAVRASRGGSSGEGSGRGFAPPSPSPDPKADGTAGASSSPRGGGGREASKEDSEFEERLRSLKRSALERKAEQEAKKFSPIDYDNPEANTGGGGTGLMDKSPAAKIGLGVAGAIFAAIFIFGDILPQGAPPPSKDSNSANGSRSQLGNLNPKRKAELQSRLEEFEAVLTSSPEDQNALEGAAVTLVELGELTRADEFLTKLEKFADEDAEVLRLHGQVQFALEKFGDSADTFRRALKLPGASTSVELLQGLTEALIALNQPKEAVDQLLAARELLKVPASDSAPPVSDSVQLELLLGKAYSSWGRTGDAAAVYDKLIRTRPEDFRGYLAKAMLFKEQGKEGDAQKMFLQAKFLAPQLAKDLVDRLATSAP